MNKLGRVDQLRSLLSLTEAREKVALAKLSSLSAQIATLEDEIAALIGR